MDRPLRTIIRVDRKGVSNTAFNCSQPRSVRAPVCKHVDTTGVHTWSKVSLNLLNISVELTRTEPEYADIAERFVYDFVQLALTLNLPGNRGYLNWDEQDGFYYDVRAQNACGVGPHGADYGGDERIGTCLSP